MNKVRAAAIAVALSVTAATPFALAQTPGDHGGAGHGRHWGGGAGERGGFGFFRGIELTDAQKAQLKQIHESAATTVGPIEEQVRAKRQELWQLNSGATFDEAAAAAKLAEIAPLEARLMAERFRARQAMFAVLTPEQKTQLDQRKAQWEQKRGEWQQKRGEQPNR